MHQKDIDNLEELWERTTRLVRSHEERLREWCLIRGLIYLITLLPKAIEERELHCSQSKNWGQWNQAAAMEIPMRHTVKILHGESNGALYQFAHLNP